MPGRNMILGPLASALPPIPYRALDRQAVCTITLPPGVVVPDAGTITITDPLGTPLVFQFIESAPFTGDIEVPYTSADTAAQMAAAFAAAVNGVGPPWPPFPFRAVAGPGGTVRIFFQAYDEVGNFAALTSTFIPGAAFTGGSSYGAWLQVAQRAIVDDTGNVVALPLLWSPLRGAQARRVLPDLEARGLVEGLVAPILEPELEDLEEPAPPVEDLEEPVLEEP
ncbi:MAG: hypothetical protein KF718_16835 [Polyangiaceae bacterium]|nr:hypothetical protein [Polyangiaceae bacterium]